MRRGLLALLGIVPLVAATAAAGIVSSPSKVRPCVVGYSTGFTGGPSHATVGPDGNLWIDEGQNDKIARFDLKTHTVREFAVPRGTQLHDLETGPDGKLWWIGVNGRGGTIDPKTFQVKELFDLHMPGAQPHLWWARDGYGYFAIDSRGLLARLNPKTLKVTSSQYNLPPNNGIHSFAAMPDGNAWFGLERASELAHFNLAEHRFDQFVKLPAGTDPHWIEYVPTDHAIWAALNLSAEFARYDLDTGRLTIYHTPLGRVTEHDLVIQKPVPSLTQFVADTKGHALWAAALAGGVLRFDLHTHKVTSVGCGLIFPSLEITLVNDPEGNVWVTEAKFGGGGAMGRIEP